MENFLKCYKTYFIAILTVLYALSVLITGNLDTATAIPLILASFGGAALRNGMEQ